jgi:hypothetical protein
MAVEVFATLTANFLLGGIGAFDERVAARVRLG